MNIKVLGSSSKGNCYVVSDGVTTLLLDCGIKIKDILRGVNHDIKTVSACFVTHSHGDHIKAARDLIYRGIPVYISPLEAAAVRLIGSKAIIHMQTVKIGTLTVRAFGIQHDTPEPLGYLLASSETGEKLLYFTDTYYIKYLFRGLTHILCECNYDLETLNANINNGVTNKALADRLLSSHMSLEHLIEMLKANDLSNVRQIYLCHLSDRNGNASRYREAIQKLTGTEVYIC